MKQCQIPPKVLEDEEAFEVLRVFLGQGGPHVSLHLGWQRTEPTGKLEPEESWGYLLADLAQHVSNALHKRTGYPREYILEQIKEKFVREVEAIKSLRGDLIDDRTRDQHDSIQSQTTA